MFHTVFNVTNTLILIWFIPQIEKLVCSLIRPKEGEDEESGRLKYIRGGLMKTPEISVLQAQKEIVVFGERIQRMFGFVKDISATNDEDAFKPLFDRIAKYEDISDNMENEIGKYLGQVSDAHLSDDTKETIREMLRQIGELESIGDSCYNIARILRRRSGSNGFTEDQSRGMEDLFTLLDRAMDQMVAVLSGEKGPFSLQTSEQIEQEINDCRSRLREQNAADLDNRVYGYKESAVFVDFVNECEKMGDYIINVVEACFGV